MHLIKAYDNVILFDNGHLNGLGKHEICVMNKNILLLPQGDTLRLCTIQIPVGRTGLRQVCYNL